VAAQGNPAGKGEDMLTAERLRELLSYDPETGVFAWKVSRRGVRPGQTGNVRPDGYLRIGIDGVNHLANRLAWLYVTGAWPEYGVDHRDGDHGNNRFLNLRDVSQQINVQNVGAATKANKSSGLLGVSYHARDGLWRARIYVDGKERCLGYFKTPEPAHEAYLVAKRARHAGCTI
jgi:hypothetical protein